jgi:hypothetical protein
VPAVPGRTETDFLSLDKRNRIGYNSIVKLGKRSGPRREHYAAMLFFPTPYSPFPIVCHGLPATRCCHATARPDPLPRMCQAGRKAPKLARRATHKKSAI